MSDAKTTTFDPYDTDELSDLSEALSDHDLAELGLDESGPSENGYSELEKDEAAPGEPALDESSPGDSALDEPDISDGRSDHPSDPDYDDTAPQPRKKRRRVTHTYQQEDEYYSVPSIHFLVDDNLKALLVDDWERITKHFCCVKLPHPKPVRQVLQDWYDYDYPRLDNRMDRDVLGIVKDGMCVLFDKYLDLKLLYNYERPQLRYLHSIYESTDKKPCDIYGAEHLIRLMSKSQPAGLHQCLLTDLACSHYRGLDGRGQFHSGTGSMLAGGVDPAGTLHEPEL